MCGELDENLQINQEVMERFAVLARRAGASAAGDGAAPSALASAEGRAAFMERVFAEGLSRALSATAAAEDDERVDAVASQAIALARLAGFIAGQLPPEADLFRAVIGAVAEGHAETTRLVQEERSKQDHHHGHHHGPVEAEHHH